MCKHIPKVKDLSEIPSSQKRPLAKPLSYYRDQFSVRDEAIVAAFNSGGFSMKELGEYFGLHYSRVSRILKKHSGK